jgi:chromosome segregation ATPase
MEKILLLLLGVAINGNLKETFIEQIQTKLNTQTQINLVPYIQLVTDDINFCLSKSIFLHLKANQTEESNSPKLYSDMKMNDMTSSMSTTPTNAASNYMLSSVHSGDLNELAFCVSNANNHPTSTVSTSIANLVSSTSSVAMVASMSKSLVEPSSSQDAQQQVKSSSICFNSLDQLNYFLNTKLMSNIQRIVDERDSYLESIIELQQDKEYLSYKLNNSNALNAANTSTGGVTTDSNGQSSQEKTSINQFILNSNLAELIRSEYGKCMLNDEQSAATTTGQMRASGQAHHMLNLIEVIFKNLRTNTNARVSSGSYSESDELSASSCENLIENILSQILKLDLNGQVSSSGNGNNNSNQNIAIELVECKIKLKQLINEIEEKCEQIETLRCEIDDVRKQVNKLRNENVELQQKAALANVYSDELESLREKSIKVDKYESDIVKLRERIDELQSNEMRLNELKDENVILIETRALMEKQLNEYQVRLLGMQRVDNDLNKYKVEIDDLMHQRELDKRRLCELCEKNAKLELEMRNLLNQNISMDEELNYFKQQCTFMTAELGKQQQALSAAQQSLQSKEALLNETTKLKKIEAENVSNEMNSQLKARDQEVSKLKESLRAREITLAEQVAQIKVLSEQLSIEQENKIKCERTLDQHKSEIKELQLKLDDCVSETRKLDASIRAAAHTNEQKESENQENFKKLIRSHEELNESYKKLLVDHEQLQKIYLQLESDFDEMYNELKAKHTNINSLSNELDEIKQQNTSLVSKCALLDAELNQFKGKTFTHQAILTDEHEANRKDMEHFYEQKFDALNAEIGQLQTKRETVETKMNELSEQLAASACENDQLREQLKSVRCEADKSVENSRARIEQLNERVQTLESMNDKLDDEKHQLFEQLHLLLQQNQEILTQTLNSKEMYHEETKAYL